MKKWFRGHGIWYRLVLDRATNKLSYDFPKFRIRPIFTWFGFWVGVYVDRKSRLIYFFPVPMIGFKIGYQLNKKSNKPVHSDE